MSSMCTILYFVALINSGPVLSLKNGVFAVLKIYSGY